VTVEEAIQTAIAFEKKVRDAYREARDGAAEPSARKFFALMAEEEQDHVAYLEAKQAEWTETGSVTTDGLATAVCPCEDVEKKAAELSASLEGAGAAPEIDRLRKALDVETEASAFYRDMVEKLPPAGRALFAKFRDIEEGHLALVQAEINGASNFGVWFDVQEFVL